MLFFNSSLIRYVINSANTDGSNYFDMGTIGIGTSNDVTMTAWVRTTDADGTIMGCEGSGAQAYRMSIAGGRRVHFIITTALGNTTFEYTPDITDGNWHHVMVHVDRGSNTGTFIVDGVSTPAGIASTSGTIADVCNPTEVFQVGKRDHGPTPLYLDSDFTNLGLSLTDLRGDVAALYNAGSPTCFESLTQVIQDKFEAFWALQNHTGFDLKELNDLTGNGYDATNVGSVPFNATGLNTYCASV